jgi:hypothetical protein
MVVKAKARIVQSRNSRTQYITIPADMVTDSQYPFKAGEAVEIEVVPGTKRLIVQSSSRRS